MGAQVLNGTYVFDLVECHSASWCRMSVFDNVAQAECKSDAYHHGVDSAQPFHSDCCYGTVNSIIGCCTWITVSLALYAQKATHCILLLLVVSA